MNVDPGPASIWIAAVIVTAAGLTSGVIAPAAAQDAVVTLLQPGEERAVWTGVNVSGDI